MRARIVLAAGLAAAVAFAAAGCGSGGSTPASGGAKLGGATAVVPADAAAFVAIDADAGSSQWQAANALLAKIPQHDALVTQLEQSFEKQAKVSWANDVKPALGPEVDVAVLPGASTGKPQVVVLTQPSDSAKLDALLAKLGSSGGTKLVSTKVDGWTAVSDSQATLDALTGATSHLSGDSLYQEASAKLAGDALVRAYANGAEAKQLLSSLGGKAPAGGTAEQQQLVWAAADVVAASGGLQVHGFVRSEGTSPAPAAYGSALVNEIPAGALVVADFQAKQEPGGQATPTSPLLQSLGKLGAALDGETALYVSPGLPLPAVTLVTGSRDPQAVLDGLQGLLGGLGTALGGSSSSGSSTGGLDLGSLLSGIHLVHETVGSHLVVSTSQAAIDAFKGSGQKLAADGTFSEARSASGMPSDTTGFVYVNLKDALPVVQGIAQLAGAKLPGGGVDLSALRTLTAWGTPAVGGVSGFTLFLEVR